MAQRKHDVTFTVAAVDGHHFSNLDDALGEASKCSVALGGKWVSVFVHAHSAKGAVAWGGPEALEHFNKTPSNEPLASVAVKTEPRGYYF